VPTGKRKERILVTGGAGFIGSHVADAALAAGHTVAVLDDLSTGERALVPPEAAFYEGDICDAAFVERVFSEFEPEVLNHHAAQMDIRRSVADPVFDARVNILGTLTLLTAAVRHRTRRVIFASTGGACYGEQEAFPAAEDHPLCPVSPYGTAKVAVETYLGAFYAMYGLSYAALRYANVYGPRQNPFGEAGVVAIFASRLLREVEPVINGDGRQTRDYVYVGDVVAANLAAIEGPETIRANIGTGRETSVTDLYQGLVEAVGWGGEAEHGPAKPGEQQRSVIDPVLAWETWGWRPQVPLSEGLGRSVAYFRVQAEGVDPDRRIRGDGF